MSKTWMIIRHEYLTNVKRRSFLIGAFVVPLISILLIGVVFGLAINNETDVTRVGTVGYVDESGVLAQALDEPDYFRAYESEAAASAALDDGSIGAYFVVTSNYMNDGMIRAFSKSGFPAALNQDIDSFMLANLSTGLDSTIAARLKDPVEVTVKTLDNGRTIRGSAVAGLFIMPIIFVMVFMIASQTTSGYLMSGVVEEKTNHIMELLVTSVTPFQMMFGKIVGLGLLGLTQLAVWIVAGYITLALGNNSFLAGITI
ncbi:MAG: ABC transporter permease, partial [Anaerolineae bacterium]|nr:ABC transporter permease [Anaerolineae bacterium]